MDECKPLALGEWQAAEGAQGARCLACRGGECSQLSVMAEAAVSAAPVVASTPEALVSTVEAAVASASVPRPLPLPVGTAKS